MTNPKVTPIVEPPIEYEVVYQLGDSGKRRKLTGIISDGFIAGAQNMIPVRFFMLKDGKRVEVTALNTVFVFSASRNDSIKQAPQAPEGA